MGPEERYAPIEGEALGLAWALEQTKYLTLGCENLTVATDHKPLVGIFNDKELRNMVSTISGLSGFVRIFGKIVKCQ